MEVPSREPNELTDGEVIMAAAESLISELFAVADDDSCYHARVSQIKSLLKHGTCYNDADEIALCILAWSGTLK